MRDGIPKTVGTNHTLLGEHHMNQFVTHSYELSNGERLSSYMLTKGSEDAYKYIDQHNIIIGKYGKMLVNLKTRFDLLPVLQTLGIITHSVDHKTIVISNNTAIPYVLDVAWNKEFPHNRVSINLWSDTANNTQAAWALVEAAFRPYGLTDEELSALVNVNWFVKTQHDGVNFKSVATRITEKVHREAYPYLDLDAFVNNYITSKSPVLLLTGTQGTGKTRFIRHIVKTYVDSIRRDDPEFDSRGDDDYEYGPDERPCSIAYSTDTDALYDEDLYVSLRQNNYQFVILEDIDFSLASRREGNDLMHKFLALSDGFMASQCRILFSTNLNVNEVDPALVRPGRCYAAVETRALSYDESMALVKVLTTEPVCLENRNHTVAEVYNAVNATAAKPEYFKVTGEQSNPGRLVRRVGFGR